MKSRIRTRFFLHIVLLFTGLVALSATSMGEAGNSFDAPKNRSVAPSQSGAHSQTRVSESYARLPLYFETNQGQTDPRVKFLSHGAGHTLFLTPSEAVLILTKTEQQD
ncbi:MAG TPA: hypothetical protein VGQ81_00865, partial [Acidobacteriota bacterium]|nr:hypothetical protein [Acidobacteriota bacterium]